MFFFSVAERRSADLTRRADSTAEARRSGLRSAPLGAGGGTGPETPACGPNPARTALHACRR